MTAASSSARGAVLITGASTGIGEACAMRLDAMDFQVFAGVRKDSDGERLRAKGSPRLTPVRIDVTDGASIAAAHDIIAAAVGARGLAGVVNNAGIAVAGPLEFLPLDDLRHQLEVNVTGQLAVTQAFLALVRQGHGRIVNIGSVSGRLSTPFVGPYSASKFAMEALTDSLRIELRPWGIHVAIVEPGSIATPIWDKTDETADKIERDLPPEGRRLYGATIPVMRAFATDAAKRGIPPDRVAQAVAHALTAKRPKTRYLVGTDARIQALLARLVPDGIRDGLIERQLKLPRTASAAAREEEAAHAR
jgi:NAD(P)-dependent dehydrogenase (short-subunit alcohol dehydrogenase family)